MTDYQTLYKELQLRCAKVAEKLRGLEEMFRGIIVNYHDLEATFHSLASELDTPIAASEAATRLAFDANEPFENEEA